MTQLHKTIKVYGAGGFGINIAKSLRIDDANVQSVYFDTSRDSNLVADDLPQAYIVPGLDGSGKNRRLNREAIAANVAPALNKFPPGDFNVVIFSCSGGSGSVAGPLMVAELVARGKLVIPVILGDTDSEEATENSLGTLKTLSALAAAKATPISTIYREIALGNERRNADNAYRDGLEHIAKLISLIGRPGSELDTMDVTNWLYYHRITDHKPGLALLNILDSNERLADEASALSVASVYGSPDHEHGAVRTAYRTTGYSFNETTHPLHFVITQNGLPAIVEQLQRKIEDYSKQKAQLAASHFSFHDSAPSDDFMHF